MIWRQVSRLIWKSLPFSAFMNDRARNEFGQDTPLIEREVSAPLAAGAADLALLTGLTVWGPSEQAFRNHHFSLNQLPWMVCALWGGIRLIVPCRLKINQALKLSPSVLRERLLPRRWIRQLMVDLLIFWAKFRVIRITVVFLFSS